VICLECGGWVSLVEELLCTRHLGIRGCTAQYRLDCTCAPEHGRPFQVPPQKLYYLFVRRDWYCTSSDSSKPITAWGNQSLEDHVARGYLGLLPGSCEALPWVRRKHELHVTISISENVPYAQYLAERRGFWYPDRPRELRAPFPPAKGSPLRSAFLDLRPECFFLSAGMSLALRDALGQENTGRGGPRRITV
jgi:hypothetical protein